MDRSRERARLLLDKAREDLWVLEIAVGAATLAAGPVGFHAQQVVEKSLKAAIVSFKVASPRTHDLNTLLARVQARGLEPPHQEAFHALNPYAVEHRYGSGALELGALPKPLAELLSMARDIIAWADSVVGK